MKQEINQALDQLFAGYINTPDLQDFREELFINLVERVQDSISGGHTEQQALTLALEELGDITEIADTLSKKKRNEFIGQAYMHKRVPVDKAHAVGYSLAGFVLAFGLVTGITSGLANDSVGLIFTGLLPFWVVSVSSFVYLGLTQETRERYPMSKKRSLIYALSAAVLSFGIGITGLFIFSDIPLAGLTAHNLIDAKLEAIAAFPNTIMASLIPFVLPALALLVFLLLTEKDRRKPWVLHQEECMAERYDEKFGYLSGALWMCAAALFVLLGFLVGWRFSWVVFLFATAAQCLLQYCTAKK